MNSSIESLKPDPPDNISETKRVLTIIYWTVCACVFIFFTTFFPTINFIASTVMLMSLSLFILPLTSYISYKLFWTSKTNHSRPKRLLIYFIVLNIFFSHLMSVGILNFINIKWDNSSSRTVSAPVGLVDVSTGKNSRSYRAWVDLPFETNCCFIPESYTTISISKAEYESFEVGKSVLYIQYREGFFGLPWLEKSVMLKKDSD